MKGNCSLSGLVSLNNQDNPHRQAHKPIRSGNLQLRLPCRVILGYVNLKFKTHQPRADCGATGTETRIYLYHLFWLFGNHSLWRDTLLSLDMGEDPVSVSMQCARLC